MRKVIQIASNPETTERYRELYALCSDGTLWLKLNGDNWKQILDVPQPEKRPDPLPTEIPGTRTNFLPDADC